jgi:phenylpropionate dioxygenase-like ring-hydroxylating dioxygenase large terminal subunit
MHVYDTRLLGEMISFTVASDGRPMAWRSHPTGPADSTFAPASISEQLPVRIEYMYLWTSLGAPPDDLFHIPEFFEPDRRNVNSGTIGIHVSAPRAVENFLDMGHFPFVHEGYLGAEPRTEVVDYEVSIDLETNEIWATECVFWQPAASATASEGQMVDYVYRVLQPYSSLLYKTCPLDPSRMDLIGLFLQAMTPEYVKAHVFLSIVDDASSDALIRYFAQTIFSQDKPILENQHPKRLPLDPQVETPIRADRSAIVYRRWLSDLGVTYGVIPAA